MRKVSAIVIVWMMTYSLSFASCQDLAGAYPSVIRKCGDNSIVWRDGSVTRYDDGKSKSFGQALEHPDPEDMFRYRYPRGRNGYGVAPKKDFDPGRIRYEPLFLKMYGDSPAKVKKRLTTIDWFGHKVRVTTVNGVASRLKAVERDLRGKPHLMKYLTPPGGGFYWRKIAGTHRLSVHSFGAAIDINVKHSAYWRWNKGAYRYRNEIPYEIVEAFEKHGFIWGGKWYHYDTMHFEYRPELLGMRGDGEPLSRKREKVSSPRTKEMVHGREYRVQRGDTLYGISRRFGIGLKRLKDLNDMETDSIHPGDRLLIPSR